MESSFRMKAMWRGHSGQVEGAYVFPSVVDPLDISTLKPALSLHVPLLWARKNSLYEGTFN